MRINANFSVLYFQNEINIHTHIHKNTSRDNKAHNASCNNIGIMCTFRNALYCVYSNNSLRRRKPASAWNSDLNINHSSSNSNSECCVLYLMLVNFVVGIYIDCWCPTLRPRKNLCLLLVVDKNKIYRYELV